MTTPAENLPRAFVLIGALPTRGILFATLILTFVATAAVYLWRLGHGESLPDGAEFWVGSQLVGLGIDRAAWFGGRKTEWTPTERAKADAIRENAAPQIVDTSEGGAVVPLSAGPAPQRARVLDPLPAPVPPEGAG